MVKMMAKGVKNVHAYECGTPTGECTGTLNKNGGGHKVHRSREEARKCYIQHLKRHGYKQLKSDQYLSPNPDEGVLIVSRVSRYGLAMKGEGPKGKGRFVKKKDSECFIT
jgi:hypothetical protein